jgi:hypothetical protein
MEFTIGCDPEVFLSSPKGFVSAAGLFPGTKAQPHRVEKGAVQVDGLALEFNIDPAKTPEEFDENIETVLTQMKEMVRQVDKDMRITFVPFARFDVKYFNDIPEENKILGCDPDYDAYKGEVIAVSNKLQNEPLRTAAGHCHLGWTKDEDPFNPVHFEDCRYVANYFHGYGVNPLGIYDPENEQRLRYYGANGAFRPKPYGVELRQYSNKWVENRQHRKQMFTFLHTRLKQLYKG